MPASANFVSLQTYGPPAFIGCNIVTGVATGAPGPCASPTATCNGVAADDTAFVSFNTWARANQGSNLVFLTIPNGANCITSTFAAQRPFLGIKNLLVSAYGASWTLPNPNEGLCFGGTGMPQNDTTYANFVTSAPGASSVTLITAGQSSRFTVGQWVSVTGGDLQGFGYPPAPFQFEFAKVTAINAGTGVISFQSPLAKGYKSTWPNFYPGDGGHAYSGGPGTLYALPSDWDTTVEIQGLTLNNQGNHQTCTNARSMTLRDVTCLDIGCIIPSQNLSWTAINYQAPNQEMEVDKIISSMSISSSTVGKIDIQSSSVGLFTLDNSSVPSGIVGATEKIVITNSALGDFQAGAIAYGSTKEVSCTNCTISGTMIAKGVTDPGEGGGGVNFSYTMASGVIVVPRTVSITNATNNGAGLIRLTVDSTAAWTTGMIATVFNMNSGTTEATGTWLLTVIDGTHLDLQGSTFVHAYTSGGQIGTGRVPWAVPGANLFWAGAYRDELAFHIVDVTGDAVNTYVQTSMAGGFPTIPTGGGALKLAVHPAPKFTCSGCSGSAAANDYALAPAGAPINSYTQRVYVGTPAGQDAHDLWGQAVSVSWNVTKAYTAAINPLQALPAEEVVLPDGSGPFYAPIINLRSVGQRLITPSGVTCPIGTCTGDANLALPDPATWFANKMTMQFNASVAGDPSPTWPSITMTIQTDQGVVNYLLKRDLDPASNDNTPAFMDEAV